LIGKCVLPNCSTDVFETFEFINVFSPTIQIVHPTLVTTSSPS
jgi:hypothetical protein